MTKPDTTWRAIAMRHPSDTRWTRIPGSKIEPAETESMAAAGDIWTRIRRDGQREVLEIKERRTAA